MGRILLAMCGVVVAGALGGAAQPQQPQQPQQQPPAADQPASGAEKARQQRPPIMITLTDAERDRESYQQQAKDNGDRPAPSPWYDLWAQGLMALWALGQLLLTGWGIVLLKGTLDATKEAVEDTGKATEAMVAANLIAKSALEDSRNGAAAEAARFSEQLATARIAADAAETQANAILSAQRPWLRLALQDLKVLFWLDGQNMGMEVEVDLSMENVGKLPTKLEWMPEFRLGFMPRHMLGSGGLVEYLQASIRDHQPGSVLTNHFPIFAGETKHFPGCPNAWEPFPVDTCHDPETDVTMQWPPEPFFVAHLLAGVRHTIPGGEGRSVCFYAITNPDGSLLTPDAERPYKRREHLVLKRIDSYSHIE